MIYGETYVNSGLPPLSFAKSRRFDSTAFVSKRKAKLMHICGLNYRKSLH